MEFERRTLWEEEPASRERLPDPVRDAAVRAVLLVAVAVTQAVIVLLLVAGGSWLTAPMMLCTVVTSVVASWAVLDVWVTRQVWAQRAGVLSTPSSAAHTLRRERRRARRRERAAAREGRPHIPRAHSV
ncbi:hypothetical protein [Actinacidiphila acididurans]|uniref:Uncharacterized protein n=1 Tax=Actinacidiphila acididurans TaxID=2784346 RepID=A0ABS2U4G6_9ACTN|nr:hypothetical protein [Actinacidiphila acididurans]MBM9510508.1 hypothetical protein [Actinacidiphila acididurans]